MPCTKMTQGRPTTGCRHCPSFRAFFSVPRSSSPSKSKSCPAKFPSSKRSLLLFIAPHRILTPQIADKHVCTIHDTSLRPTESLHHSTCQPSLRLPLSRSGTRLSPPCLLRPCWWSPSTHPGQHHALRWPQSSPPSHQNIPSQTL